jgi:hypothetical protein
MKKTTKEIAYSLYPDMVKSAEAGKCPICDELITPDFTDEQSKKEWELSGICQDCQNAVFN